ncbi:sterol desaturase [Xenococcus sp. PCC 7305]|uniref:sterol desaturase family protein n=1 Tax=Xenococcus sp. PCC 7305 TaxID=102125 RepID=UPI0002ABDA07|nr:sterol desaturase family protein [Xenococcus sp. PCC 7305]ELS00847.1 sterol desaturase [Xenococcus sp. PCC 7305]
MVNLVHVLTLILFAIAAFIVSSLVEYFAHRLMHIYPKAFPPHPQHHIENTGQGFFLELVEYVKFSCLAMLTFFPFSWELGWSWLIGSLAYAIFAAYAHQLQHDNPKACFWMKMPVHYVHHEYDQWHHNFGLGVDWWDHVFGTYKEADWLVEKAQDVPKRKPLKLKWY